MRFGRWKDPLPAAQVAEIRELRKSRERRTQSKLPASPCVFLAGVPVADRGGKTVDVGFCDFGACRGDQPGTRAFLLGRLDLDTSNRLRILYFREYLLKVITLLYW
jgi:hypothetical protein